MSSQPTIHNFSHDAMRTRFWLRIADEDAGYAKSASEGLFHFLDDLDFQIEAGHDSGPITSINGMPEGALVTASDHVRALWDFAQNLRDETGKAFDVSGGKLFKYWEARGDTVSNPDDAEWTRLWADYQAGSFVLDGAQFTCVKAGAEIDFGALTRGYALDRMAELLENNWGIHRALLMAGGSAVLALDPPGDANGWRVGVGDRAEIKLCRFALASKSNAKRPAHLLDLRQGTPVTLAAPVRAICTSALEAEGVAMAAAVLSPAEVGELVNHGCSRGAWLPDGSRLGSVAYFEVTERPVSAPAS